jgi:putative flavoprotein involved in K+ transport
VKDVKKRDLRNHKSVIVVGGGQAGLSMSHCLKKRGTDHVVFEEHRIGHEWRTKRWDSFCLVTPNWQCTLPGFSYRGPESFGFMKKAEVVRYIEDYAASFDPPVLEGTRVTALRRTTGGLYECATTAGDFTAEQVVVAIGGYHVPNIPRIAERFPADIRQLHSSEYKSAAALPEGDVLVVGTGQSVCQIAEDLHLEGRRVHLCVGGAPRTARRYRGKDVVEWLDAMGYYSIPVHEHPLKERVRAKANHYVTGRDGGRDIDLRKFALEGMRLYGRLSRIAGTTLEFADDLKQNLDQADSVADSIKDTIDRFIEGQQIAAPAEARYKPVWEPDPVQRPLDLSASNIRTVIWSVGFRPDYRFVEVPVFDGKGYPGHQRGVTSSPGLYFLGLPWLHTWGSGRLSGVAQDAEYLAERIADRAVATPIARNAPNELALGS